MISCSLSVQRWSSICPVIKWVSCIPAHALRAGLFPLNQERKWKVYAIVGCLDSPVLIPATNASACSHLN